MAEVERLWGSPTQSHTMPYGARLIYSLGPQGHNVYVTDFNRQGRLLRNFDAMTRDNLSRVAAGWKKWEVEREFGPAFWLTRFRVSSNLSAVYKYAGQFAIQCFYVEYGADEVVISTATRDATSGRDLFPGEREC